MQIQKSTDFALRILLFLATNRGDKITVRQIAEAHNLSFNHCSKICQFLAKLDLIEAERGRFGGVRLSKEPKQISIGYIVRESEKDRKVVSCLMHDHQKHHCTYTGFCGLTGILGKASEQFYRVLDEYTLDDATPAIIAHMFNQGEASNFSRVTP